MSELKIDLINNETQGVKFEVTLELIVEMAELMHNCSWISIDERFAYMKSCVTGSEDYNCEEWSVDGKGEVAIDRDVISLEKGE